MVGKKCCHAPDYTGYRGVRTWIGKDAVSLIRASANYISMRRRDYLAGSVGIATLIAGCAGDPASQQATEEPTETPEPEFELVSTSSPEEVEIGDQLQYGFEVRNLTDRAATFQTEVRTRTAGGEWRPPSTWETEIPAGETAMLESQEFTAEYIGDFEAEIGTFDELITVVLTSATRGWGYPFQVFNGAEVAVIDVHFEDEIEGYSPENGQFARIYVSAENTANDIIRLPAPQNFSLLLDNQQLEIENITEGEYYSGGEVQPGVVRDGYLNFVVPDGTSKEDLTAVWARTFAEGDVAVYWESGGGEG
jgi:hypothetical protein